MSRLIDADALIADLMDRGVDQMQTDDFTEIVQAVQDAPTIEPEPQWIPVSERLPECGKPVLWSNECGSVFTSAITVMTDHSWAIGKRHRLAEVIAWMPLPKPYEGGVK